jgi:hypothetical protein
MSQKCHFDPNFQKFQMFQISLKFRSYQMYLMNQYQYQQNHYHRLKSQISHHL